MESLGEYLKREREYRNISLEEIARSTKIQQGILAALEQDQVDSQASPVFVKGFLRAYATYVGLNPNDVVLRYEDSLKTEKQGMAQKTPPRARKRWIFKYVVLPVATLLCVGALLFLMLHGPVRKEEIGKLQPSAKVRSGSISRPESEPQTAGQRTASLTENRSQAPDILPEPPPPVPSRPPIPALPAAPSGIELRLEAAENTWLRIQIDEGPPEEVLLREGETISRLGQSRIDMKIGNAGGLEIFLNGRRLDKLGESGEVIQLSFTPDAFHRETSRRSLPSTP